MEFRSLIQGKVERLLKKLIQGLFRYLEWSSFRLMIILKY